MTDGQDWQPELGELRRREHLAREMGGPERVERQRAAGKLTVRERIAHERGGGPKTRGPRP